MKRNIERFPQDFMLRLSDVEYAALISQIATSRPERAGKVPDVLGGIREISRNIRGPYSYTELR